MNQVKISDSFSFNRGFKYLNIKKKFSLSQSPDNVMWVIQNLKVACTIYEGVNSPVGGNSRMVNYRKLYYSLKVKLINLSDDDFVLLVHFNDVFETYLVK